MGEEGVFFRVQQSKMDVLFRFLIFYFFIIIWHFSNFNT
jgi:hypothetical protein